LPRGLLREPISGLHRADLIVVTRCDRVSEVEVERIEERLSCYEKPIVRVAFEPTCLVGTDGAEQGFSILGGQTIGAFCGIGNPDAFRSTLKQIGVDPKFFEALSDHCHYDVNTVGKLIQLAQEYEVSDLLCTEKDLVKLKGVEFPATISGVRIAPVLRQGQDEFRAAVNSINETVVC
ncbi:MAG: tetraacyldisaccharide 4'-kinase, partial [Planctomycetaceae bacterium]